MSVTTSSSGITHDEVQSFYVASEVSHEAAANILCKEIRAVIADERGEFDLALLHVIIVFVLFDDFNLNEIQLSTGLPPLRACVHGEVPRAHEFRPRHSFIPPITPPGVAKRRKNVANLVVYCA
eukprot:CAMPEP_0118667516 /NCGR_PEP_ID=MMETSP0785-20121206/19833_1 /TAXON_ID=91992 /ORGANISM="Bolidomonas pacifica, Strain CCMP 1866" /LENGTH=123 /DNA_ID=CAMNT_0006561985 /DNA_START=9 /DNA_END=380 /DNA_ORIENTATION=-